MSNRTNNYSCLWGDNELTLRGCSTAVLEGACGKSLNGDGKTFFLKRCITQHHLNCIAPRPQNSIPNTSLRYQSLLTINCMSVLEVLIDVVRIYWRRFRDSDRRLWSRPSSLPNWEYALTILSCFRLHPKLGPLAFCSRSAGFEGTWDRPRINVN
jgi:hypothetical protein